MTLTAEQLTAIMPRASEGWVDPLNRAMQRFGIATGLEVADFLAQIAVESAELTHLEESFAYRPDRLMVVWPHKFPKLEVAVQYVERGPHAIADYVYADRLGNGDENTGDGWRYRGQGPIQITFADNYRAFGRVIGDPTIMLAPVKLQTKEVGALAAAWFWNVRGLNWYADAGDLGDFDTISRRINGGTNGAEARRKYREKALAALGVAA